MLKKKRNRKLSRKEIESNSLLKTAKGVLTDWQYIEDAPDKVYESGRRRVFRCKCKCGRLATIQYHNIRSGRSLNCGKGKCKIAPHAGIRNIETSYNSLMTSYKYGARKRNYEFSLSMEEFKFLLSQNCFYCGVPPSQLYRILKAKTGEVRAGQPFLYNGIDRIDNTQGYTMENCITCCGNCNYAKSNFSQVEFLNWVKRIYLNLNLQNNVTV